MTSPGDVRAGSAHTVLADADGAAYSSLRQRPVDRSERYALGRALRKRVPRSALGDWAPPDDRPDPVQQVIESHEGRVEELVPVRVGRMIESPYGFLRGAAGVMADDVAHLPATGITPVVCGDAHLGNFGFYASPERDLVIDLNDFDEAHPGSWEWDVRRLVASIWVAGRQNGASEDECGAAVHGVHGVVPRGGPPPRRPAAALALLPAARRRPARGGEPRSRCAPRCSGPPGGRGTARATGRCRGSPARSRAGAGSSTSRR